jgi:single-strand selective monofunctional uracil DNA glycosylase
MSTAPAALLAAARELAQELRALSFAPPVSHVYNPLDYAWATHAAYLERYGAAPKRVVFLGMNPGPFGMAQTGVPFGVPDLARGWLGIDGQVARAAHDWAGTALEELRSQGVCTR